MENEINEKNGMLGGLVNSIKQTSYEHKKNKIKKQKLKLDKIAQELRAEKLKKAKERLASSDKAREERKGRIETNKKEMEKRRSELETRRKAKEDETYKNRLSKEREKKQKSAVKSFEKDERDKATAKRREAQDKLRQAASQRAAEKHKASMERHEKLQKLRDIRLKKVKKVKLSPEESIRKGAAEFEQKHNININKPIKYAAKKPEEKKTSSGSNKPAFDHKKAYPTIDMNKERQKKVTELRKAKLTSPEANKARRDRVKNNPKMQALRKAKKNIKEFI